MILYIVFNEVPGGIGDICEKVATFSTQEKAQLYIDEHPVSVGIRKRCNLIIKKQNNLI